MKFLIVKEQGLDPCRFCPFTDEVPCNVEGPSCSFSADGIEIVFCEIKYVNFIYTNGKV